MSIIVRAPRELVPAEETGPGIGSSRAVRAVDRPDRPDQRSHAALAGVLIAAPFTLLALILCVVLRPGVLESIGIVLGTNVGVFSATIAASALAALLRGRGPSRR